MRRLLTALILVFICLGGRAQFQGLIVNEFSQGTTGNPLPSTNTKEYIELVVVGVRTCTDSTADLRGWILDDQNGWYGNSNGATGHYRFKYDPNWANVPFGSVILIYNAGDKNTSITSTDDPTDSNHDYTYIVPNTSTFLEQNSSEPGSSSGSVYVYPTNGYSPTTNQWSFLIALNNTGGDVISVVRPSNLGAAAFSIGYGYTINGGYQTPTVSIGNVGTASNAYLSNSNYTSAAAWTIGVVPTNETPASPNGGANTTWINSMRQQVPSITTFSTANDVCFRNSAQTTTLSYSATTNSPTNYSITWNSSPSNGFATVSGVSLPSSPITITVPAATAPGTYTGNITVSNATGTSCVKTFTVTVKPIPAIAASAAQPIICSGSSTALTATGANTYSWSPSTNLSSATGSTVTANPASTTTYVVTGTAVNGCTNTASVTVTVSTQPPAPTVDTTQPGCTISTGSITINNPTGSGFTYSIGSGYTASPSFTNLVPNTYIVTVKNNDGCTSPSTSVTIHPQPVTPTVSVNSPTVCPGSSATMVATPFPAGTYTYTWTVPAGEPNPGNVASFTATTAGTYSVTVTNANGCSAAASGTLDFQATATVVADDKIVCVNSTVQLTAQPSGGTWTGAHVSGAVFNASGLTPGPYTVTYHYSSAGCGGSDDATITVIDLPANPVLNVSHPTCSIATGSITVTSPAGVDYSIDGINFSSVNSFTNLQPGPYTIWVRNAGGCVSTATATINAQPATPSAAVVQVTQPNCSVATGTVTVTSPNGLLYSIDGISFSGQQVYSSLAPGSYTITVKNSDGCLSPSTTVTIDQQPATPAAPGVSVVNNCDGTSTLTATGVTGSLLWSNNATTNPIIVSTAGTYTVTQTANGCTSQQGSGLASPGSAPQTPVVSTAQPNCTIAAGTITVTSPSGSGLTYSIDGINYQPSNFFSGLAPGSYAVTVKNNTGCISSTVNAAINAATPALVQTLDTVGCGSVVFNGITYTTSTVLRDTVRTVINNCDSIIHLINVIVNSVPVTNINACISQGNSYSFGSQVLTTTGHYTNTIQRPNQCDSIVNLYLLVSTVQTNNISGCGVINFNNVNYMSSTVVRDTVRSTVTNCDSIIHITTITVYAPSPPTSINVCLAEGQTYHFNGTVLTASGNYITHYTNVHGCDSTVNLHLLVAQSQTLDLYGCSSLVYHGTTYTSSTTLTETIPSTITACDSIHLTINIHISSVVYASLNVCLSQGQSYNFNGTVIGASGFYTDTLTAQAGCDSIIRLYVVVSNTQQQNYSACGSYSYNGVSYHASTIVRDTLHSVVTGCDSVIRVANIVITAPPAPVQVAACIAPGQSYNFNGSVLTNTGHYSTHYTSAQGCDSTVNLYLLVAIRDTIHLQGCSSVVYNNIHYSASTTVYDTLHSALTSCDSIYRTVSIVISNAVSSSQAVCLQPGQTHNFNGQIISATGHYIDTLSSVQGCDSIVHLYAVVSSVQTQAISGCSPLMYNGIAYTSSAMIRDTLHSTVTGCDSIIHITNITVLNPSAPTSFQQCIGEGANYNFNGTVLTTTGSYTTHYSNSQGCDSTVHLYLLVTRRDTLNLQGCSSVNFNGNVYTSSATLHDTIVSVITGCDSLHRTINIIINNSINTNATVCLQQGQVYNFNGTVLSATGHYVDTLTAQQGCDSIVHLYLLVSNVQSQNLFGCGTYLYNGVTYQSSTVVRDTVRSVVTNCDSVIRIANIVINQPVQSYTGACLLQGQNYNFNGQLLNSSGNYSTIYPRPGQCDSIVHLNLVVSTTSSQNINGCGTVNYNGVSYNTSTLLRDTVHSLVTGCDSIYHLVYINVSPAPVTNTTACIVAGQSYNFNGQSLTATGHYSTTFQRPNQCDSIVNLFLLVRTTQTQTINGCGVVVYNGVTYTSSTVARDTVKSVLTGCDSIIRIADIQLGSVSVSSMAVCLPPGQVYHFNGSVLSSSGQYLDTLTSWTGCDSIVHLFLTIASVQTIDLDGCDSVSYNGNIYTSSTTLHENIASVITGCDSVLRTINILVHPKPVMTISPDKTVCTGTPVNLVANANGASINWPGIGNGNTITVAPNNTTSYTAMATSPNGCTNTATVTITVADFNLNLTADPNPVIAGTTVQLQTSGTSSYHVLSWQPSQSFASQNATAQHLWIDSSINVIVIASSSSGCIDTASVMIVADPLGDIFIPSAFTPNGDGKNDLFRVLGGNIKEIDLKIFNRWGQMIFNTHERMKGWDGTVAGKLQPTGNYVYTVRALLKNGTVINKKGTVLLIR